MLNNPNSMSIRVGSISRFKVERVWSFPICFNSVSCLEKNWLTDVNGKTSPLLHSSHSIPHQFLTTYLGGDLITIYKLVNKMLANIGCIGKTSRPKYHLVAIYIYIYIYISRSMPVGAQSSM